MKYMIFSLIALLSLNVLAEERFLGYEDVSPRMLEIAESASKQTVDMFHQNGVNEFDYDETSIKLLSDFITKERVQIPENSQRYLADIWGSYLGNAIIKEYGGKWVKLGTNYGILVRESYVTFPINKAYKHIVNGEEDAIYALYVSIGHNIKQAQP